MRDQKKIEETKAEGIRLRQEITALLEKNGFTVQGKLVYDADICNFTFKCVKADASLDATPEGRAFKAYGFEHGLPAEALGAKITARGSLYGMTIVGFRARSPKRPMVIKAEDGKVYVTTSESIARIWKTGGIEGVPYVAPAPRDLPSRASILEAPPTREECDAANQ